MRKVFKLILIIYLMFLFSHKITYSEEKKFIYDHHKKILIEKKLLLNSFKKSEEYINETSVELFLNCSDKNEKKKWKEQEIEDVLNVIRLEFLKPQEK